METKGIFNALQHTTQGLKSQMRRLELISENIANAEALPDEKGELYQRKVLETRHGRSGVGRSFGDEMNLKLKRSSAKHVTSATPGQVTRVGGRAAGMKVIEVEGEKVIHDPNHPRADEDGYVRLPNVNMIEEMVDLMAASRSYEANISVMNAAKSMAKRTFEI